MKNGKKIIILVLIVIIFIEIALIVSYNTKSFQEQLTTEQLLSVNFQPLSIKTWTFFGECAGYCEKDITITPEKIIFHKNWRGEIEITEELPITTEQWNILLELLDFDKFKSLEEEIWCPDCVDQGGEWIEINDWETNKKVVFGFNDEISDIDEFLTELWKIRNDIFLQFN